MSALVSDAADRVFAHGIGGAKDLPIPFGYFLVGACAALAVSFLVLTVAWRRTRYDARTGGLPVPISVARVLDGRALVVTLRLLGMAIFLYVGWAAVAGPDRLVNPAFGVLYVIVWVGLVPASLGFGAFYRAVSPLRTMHLLFARATGADPERGLVDLPAGVGLWPAAVMLFSFVWLELVYPGSIYLSAVHLWVAGYLAVVVLGGAVFGSRWIAQADPFEAYSTLVSRLSIFGRRGDGTLVLRSPLANLDGTPAVPGLVAVVSVLFGSTAFDSFSGSTFWLRITQSTQTSGTLLDTAALVGFCLVVGLSFAAATMTTGARDGTERSQLPALFAHSVVPIIVGYIVAHYLSFFVEQGQQTLVLLSDPLARGDNLLGTADWQVSYWLSSHPTFLAVSKVAAVVTGHVVGVIAAHDRAMRLLPDRHRLTGQLPLLLVMVFYTVSGLYLLFGA